MFCSLSLFFLLRHTSYIQGTCLFVQWIYVVSLWWGLFPSLFPWFYVESSKTERENVYFSLSDEKGLILLCSFVVQHRPSTRIFFAHQTVCEKINTVKSTISREACVFGRLNRICVPFIGRTYKKSRKKVRDEWVLMHVSDVYAMFLCSLLSTFSCFWKAIRVDNNNIYIYIQMEGSI